MQTSQVQGALRMLQTAPPELHINLPAQDYFTSRAFAVDQLISLSGQMWAMNFFWVTCALVGRSNMDGKQSILSSTHRLREGMGKNDGTDVKGSKWDWRGEGAGRRRRRRHQGRGGSRR